MTPAMSPPISPTSHGSGEIRIGPPRTYFAELGELVEHRVTVTNNATHPVLADLSWNVPPPEWFVSIFASDGRTPLPDMNLNGLPDVSLGMVRSASESAIVVLAVQVPSVAPPQLEIVTQLVASVPGTSDSDAVDLLTGIGPWVTLDRLADPSVINITGSGGVEQTTIVLSVRGEGPPINQPVPIDVVFEIDRSGSMSWSDPTDLRIDAVKGYIDRMTPDDRGSVVGFDYTAWVVNNRPLTSTDALGRTLLKADVETLRGAGGGTNLDAALQLGTDWIITYGDRAKKRIEILLTDGIGTNGNTDAILDQAIAEGIVIYTVGLGTSIDEAYLRYVATRTGGEYLHADNAGQLAELYEDLANRTIDTAASDPDPTDFDPMVVDVLPPFIHYVFGSSVDPATNAPMPPLLDGVDGDGNRVLGWNVAILAINETWTVAFRVTSSLGGLVPTNVYGLSRVAFDDFKGRGRVLSFPEVLITVLAPPPLTSLSVGTPRVVGAATYVTSATPVWFLTQDRSATGIRRTMFRLNGSPWIDFTGGGTFTLFPEGEHLVEWFSEDNIGDMEASQAATFRVDNSPPQTHLLVGTPKYASGATYITSATPLTLQGIDGGITPVGIERVEYRVDGGQWMPYSASFLLIAQGLHTVEYRSRDLLGNAEPGHTATLYVDGIGPIFRVTPGTPIFAAAETWVTSHTEIELGAQDMGTPPVGLESFEYRVWFGAWSDWVPYAGPFLLSPEGRHVIEMRARDHLENAGSGSATFYVDDTPPALTFSVGSPKVVDGATFVTSDTLLFLRAAEGGPIPVGLASFEFRIDGGAWSAYVDAFLLAGEGPHDIEYRGSDRLGNAASRSVTVIVDDTPPTVSLDVGTPRHVSSATWITSNTEIELAAEDGGLVPVGLEFFEYREWFGAWSPWTPYLGALRLVGEGLHTLEVRVSDRLGHVAVTEADIIVDDSPPIAVLTLGQPIAAREATYITSATTLTLQAEDRGVLPVGLRDTEYRLGADAWRASSQSFVVTGPDGPYRVEFQATDLLGHATSGDTVIVLDNTPPETLVSLSFDPEIRAASLTLAAVDTGSGLAGTMYLLNQGTWEGYREPIPLAVGRHALRFQSVDHLGNLEPEKLYVIVIPGDGPWVAWNWTPTVAFTFAVVLIGLGVVFTRRERGRGAMAADSMKASALVVPFVAGELATGLLSVYVPLLRMPPVLGWAIIVLLAVLVSGIGVSWQHARAVPAPPAEEPVTRPILS